MTVKHDPTAVYGLQGETTESYRSPEVFGDEAPSEKADMWAAGIILYRLRYGKHPFEGKNKTKAAMMHNIVNLNLDYKEESD